MDYETRATNRNELRLLAKFFRTICGFTQDEPIDPVELLDRLPDFENFDDVYYDVVEDSKLKHLAYYDEKHRQSVSIDLAHPHNGIQPHRHVYLSHNKKKSGVPPTKEELALIKKIRKEFHLK